jgi:hypothetical protein
MARHRSPASAGSGLFGAPEPPPLSPVPALFAHHAALFEARFRRRPVYVPGKDGSLLLGLLRQLDVDELCDLLDRFFASSDPFVHRSGYTIGVFASQINRLIAARPTVGSSGSYPEFECPHEPKHTGRHACHVQTILDDERLDKERQRAIHSENVATDAASSKDSPPESITHTTEARARFQARARAAAVRDLGARA